MQSSFLDGIGLTLTVRSFDIYAYNTLGYKGVEKGLYYLWKGSEIALPQYRKYKNDKITLDIGYILALAKILF